MTAQKIVTTNNPIKMLVLGLQHLIAMFGATVLVPYLTGLDPAVALIAAGGGTLIFQLCTNGKVPVFLGSSFAFIGVIITVKEMHGGDLGYAQGGIIAAGLLYVILSFFIKRIGVHNVKKVLPNHVVGPIIVIIGFSLLPVALDMARNFQPANFQNSSILFAIITLGTTLAISYFGRGFLKQLSILVGVAVGYIVCLLMGVVDATPMTSAAWVAIPNFTLPKFDWASIAIITPVVLSVFMEHIGDVTTNGEVCEKNFIEDPGLNRTLLGDGLATIFSACIGGPANTTYGENTGVLAITKNYNPAILRIAAILAIIIGFVAKIGGFLKSIPVPVMGGISIMLFGMIAFIGIQTMRNGKVKFTWQNITVIVVVLLVGLGTAWMKHYFNIQIGLPVTETIKMTGLALAALIGVVLNLILNWKQIVTSN